MAHGSPNYRMANRLSGGELDHILTTCRDEGLSYNAISAQLFARFGIEVSAPTVGQWLHSLPVADDAA
jgi:hypothetical protein